MNKLPTMMLLCAMLVFAAGCRHVPMVSQEQDAASKQFKAPSPDMAGIYIFRVGTWSGRTQVKSIYLDGQLLGGLANKTYFDFEVTPGLHTLSTQPAPGPNDLEFTVGVGRNYYFGLEFSKKVPVVGIVVSPFVSKVSFEQVSEQDGRAAILDCQRAVLQNYTNPVAPAALAASKPSCIAALESDAELQPIKDKVALSGKEDNLAALEAIKQRPTRSERKLIMKWQAKREQCFREEPPPRDSYYQLSTDTFNLGQKLIHQLGRGRMSYGQFAHKREEIRQASIAKAQALHAK